MGNKSLIIGSGTGSGLSKYLSENLKIESVPSRNLNNINLSKYDNIIYTSSDPAFDLNEIDIQDYLEKNIINIYKLINSQFNGIFTYISSVDSGVYKVISPSQKNQILDMYTPYSFSKYSAELLLSSNKSFVRTNILRIGYLWPGRKDSNLYKARYFLNEKITLNLNSCFYITPRSLLLNYIKNESTNLSESKKFGYLTSTNKIFLKDLFKLRNIEFALEDDKKYIYLTRNKDKNISNLVTNSNFNWEEEEDFDAVIAEALYLKGKEILLPNR